MGDRHISFAINRQRQSGFTLLELMVTIAVFAVIFGIAIPSFSSFIAAQRVRAASFDLNASLIQARSEATKRNTDVVIQQASGGWQNGWSVNIVGAPSGTPALGQHDVLPNTAVTAVDTAGNTVTSITLQGTGRQPAGSPAITFNFSPSPSINSVTSRCLMVDSSGKATTAC